MRKAFAGMALGVLALLVAGGLILSQAGILQWSKFVIVGETGKVTATSDGMFDKAIVEQKYTCGFDKCEITGYVNYIGGKESNGYQYDVWYYDPVLTTCVASCDKVLGDKAAGSSTDITTKTEKIAVSRGDCFKVCGKFAGYGAENGNGRLASGTAWIEYKDVSSAGKFTPPDNMFVAVTTETEKTKSSSAVADSYSSAATSVEFTCSFDQCYITGKAQYSGEQYSSFVYMPSLVKCNKDCSYGSIISQPYNNPYSTPSEIIGNGECIKGCVKAGRRATATVWIEWKGANFLPKCAKDPVTGEYMEPDKFQLYDGQYNLCSGERCRKCPDDYTYCYVKCEGSFEGVIKGGETKVLDKDIVSCPLGSNYMIEGWSCPTPQVPPPVEECGDGIVQENLGEECEYPNTNNNQYCASQSAWECQGKRYGVRPAVGDCDAVCQCQMQPFTYSCVQGQCGAECSDSDTIPCTTADGIPGIKKCLNDCTMSETCYQTGVCKPGSKHCSGDFVEICSPDGKQWQRQYPACSYGCSGGECNKKCGDGIINQDFEICDPPAANSGQCPQTTSECSDKKTGVRDAYGTCNSGCGCDYDDFTYSCIKGQCGAECSDGETDTTCTVDGVPGERSCQAGCTWGACQPTGVCVPGTTEPCGDCGIKTCSQSGAWGACQKVENQCGDGYECKSQ
jgi:hypothetical protein